MDHVAFLRAIHDRPGDALPRLIYADFLDERGRAGEAAWVRADVRVAVGFSHPDPADLRVLRSHHPPAGVPSLAQMKASRELARKAARFFGLAGPTLAGRVDELVRRGRLPSAVLSDLQRG
jgi:uncharacterized protein (TIGR02996 family)